MTRHSSWTDIYTQKPFRFSQADISELENVELLEKIKEMEETELNKGVKKSGGESNLKFSKLEPIQDGGADKLLQAVILFSILAWSMAIFEVTKAEHRIN